MRRLLSFFCLATLLSGLHTTASAQQYNRLCDPAHEDCRAPILDLIRNETVGIDVAFWFMEDSRYANALIEKHRNGVPVRVMFDRRPWTQYGYVGPEVPIQTMKDGGIPLREKTGSTGILHFKTFIFAGQNVVEFSGANFSAEAFVYEQPYANYIDEIIVFSEQPSIVNSFKRRFDDIWTDVSTGSQAFASYANITGPLQRHYPTYAIDPELSFSPWNSFAERSLARYRAETAANGGRIDVIMYRITDRRHTDEIIAARQRGVPVRLVTEQDQYRDPLRPWHSWNVDRLYMAGVAVRQRAHLGLSHEKMTLLHGQRMFIVGSSNWTGASDQSQHEHNLFTTQSWMYTWATNHFDRKWNNLGPSPETKPFVPLQPDAPSPRQPANSGTNQPLSVTLKWYAGMWAHKYDVYLGTDPAAMTKVLTDSELGPSLSSGELKRWSVSGLAAGTTYYWKVVSRTMANVEKAGPIWSFRTQGGAPVQAGPSDVVLWASRAATRPGWSVVADSTAAGGARLENRDAGAPRVLTPAAAPATYFEMTFTATAGVPYRLWLRGKAYRNEYTNDSVYVQFSDSVTSSGAATFRIGTTSGTAVSVEECTNCGLSNWGWADNGYGGSGALIYFASTGTHSIRLQQREDGVSIDQIILSRDTYLNTAPGQPKDDATIYPAQGGSAGEAPGGGETPTLPTGWSSRDIGAVGSPGSAGETNGAFTVAGSGADVWGSVDEFHFASRTLTGDGSIVARVTSVANVDVWTKAGVMMRDGLTAGAAHAFMLVSPGRGLAFQRRVAAGGVSTHTSGGAGTAPAWVRITRAGNTFSAYRSADGATWTLVGTDTIPMSATISVGLAVTSHNDGATAEAAFADVAVTGGS